MFQQSKALEGGWSLTSRSYDNKFTKLFDTGSVCLCIMSWKIIDMFFLEITRLVEKSEQLSTWTTVTSELYSGQILVITVRGMVKSVKKRLRKRNQKICPWFGWICDWKRGSSSWNLPDVSQSDVPDGFFHTFHVNHHMVNCKILTTFSSFDSLE